MPKCGYCGLVLKTTKYPVLDANAKKKMYFCCDKCLEEYKIKHEKVEKTLKIPKVKQQKEPKATPSKEPAREIDPFEKMFYDYLWIEIMDRIGNFPSLRKQTDGYKARNGYKWSGMYITIKYWHEVLQNQWNYDYGVGQIFDFGIYEEAKEYYEELNQLKQRAEQGDYSITEKTIEVKIQPNKLIDKYFSSEYPF